MRKQNLLHLLDRRGNYLIELRFVFTTLISQRHIPPGWGILTIDLVALVLVGLAIVTIYGYGHLPYGK